MQLLQPARVAVPSVSTSALQVLIRGAVGAAARTCVGLLIQATDPTCRPACSRAFAACAAGCCQDALVLLLSLLQGVQPALLLHRLDVVAGVVCGCDAGAALGVPDATHWLQDALHLCCVVVCDTAGSTRSDCWQIQQQRLGCSCSLGAFEGMLGPADYWGRVQAPPTPPESCPRACAVVLLLGVLKHCRSSHVELQVLLLLARLLAQAGPSCKRTPPAFCGLSTSRLQQHSSRPLLLLQSSCQDACFTLKLSGLCW